MISEFGCDLQWFGWVVVCLYFGGGLGFRLRVVVVSDFGGWSVVLGWVSGLTSLGGIPLVCLVFCFWVVVCTWCIRLVLLVFVDFGC